MRPFGEPQRRRVSRYMQSSPATRRLKSQKVAERASLGRSLCHLVKIGTHRRLRKIDGTELKRVALVLSDHLPIETLPRPRKLRRVESDPEPRPQPDQATADAAEPPGKKPRRQVIVS